MDLDLAKLSAEVNAKYTIVDKTFCATVKDNPKDKVEIELGDSKTADSVLPQQKIMRWDNECNVSLRLKDFTDYTVDTDKEKIKLVNHTKEVHFYELTGEDHPDGASEFEVILKEKPQSNVIEFSLVDKDVEYFYQPPLNEVKLEKGQTATETDIFDKDGEVVHHRPENVVGSYVVYAKTPKINIMGGKEYRCGKVGTIYRPEIIDSAGNKVWGKLHIEDGLLSVTIPQEFLDEAVYPVRHATGLTFGYTSIGGSSALPGGNIYSGSVFTSPSDMGNATKVTFYGGQYSSCKGLIHKHSDLTLVAVGDETGSTGGSAAWWDSSVGTTELSASTDYLLGVVNQYGAYFYYDTGATNQGHYKTSYSFNSPGDLSSPTLSTKKYSIYCTYTASASGTNIKINIGDTWKDVSEMKINIGDTWKTVSAVKINIGDTWKDVF